MDHVWVIEGLKVDTDEWIPLGVYKARSEARKGMNVFREYMNGFYVSRIRVKRFDRSSQ